MIKIPGGTGISLREAIRAISAANNTTGADEIHFSSALNGMSILLDRPGMQEDVNIDGDLDVTDLGGLTIIGNGKANTFVDGNDD